MPKQAKICDEDCFKCPYPDCINDGMTAGTYHSLDEIEKELLFPRSIQEKKLAAQKREYYEANREKIAAQRREYYEANREKIAAYQREYYEANWEKLAAQKREYYEANREKITAQRRERYRKRKEEKANGNQREARTAGDKPEGAIPEIGS